MKRILRTPADLTPTDIRALYDGFDAPIAALDCGLKCAPHNPSGKPFCCDICHAVPAAYTSEWAYLQPNTDLWHIWRGDECPSVPNPSAERARLEAQTPPGMILLACLGPHRCQRNFRALSCRQFPFFPYVSSDYRFLGLAYEWTAEPFCWVVSHLEQVTPAYRQQFIATFDRLFALFQDEFDNYAEHSAQLREYYAQAGRRFALLHRNGRNYLVSPVSERMVRVESSRLKKFGPYK
ncbi:MAG: hypothetical protein WHV44_05975 [Anaerolineales bacterium]